MSQMIPDMDKASADAQTDAKDAQESLALIEKFDMQSNQDLEFAVGITAEIKEKLAVVDKRRKGMTALLREVIDKIDGLFNPILGSLRLSEKVLKKKIADFHVVQRQRRDAFLEVGNHIALLAADECIIDEVPGMSYRESWGDGEVVDVSKIPAEYLIPDIKALKATTKAKGTDPKIPGWQPKPSSVVTITVAKVVR